MRSTVAEARFTRIDALTRFSCEAGFISLILVSVFKVSFNIGECIYRVSFRGYKKYIPYFMYVPKP